jgi:hypothetical protein
MLGNPAQPLTQYHVYEVAAQNGSWNAWINGVLLGSISGNTYKTNSAPTLGYSFGPQDYFLGYVAEVLVFNRTLTAGERQTVSEYLNSKYGLVAAVPPTPTNLVANAISTNQISLSWSEVLTNGGATQISVARSTNSAGPFAGVATVVNSSTYVDTNLLAGTTYYYEVQAINLTGWSPFSNEAQATTMTNGVSLPFGDLVLWLKGDSGLTQLGMNTPVGFWADQSGRGNNAIQPTGSKQPLWVTNTLNGLPVIWFNPTNFQDLTLPNLLAGTTGAEGFVVLKAGAASGVNRSLWEFGGYAGGYSYYPNSSGQIEDDFGSSTLNMLGNPAQPLTQYHVYEVAAQNGSWGAAINTMPLLVINNNLYSINSAPTLGYSFGPQDYFLGYVAEVMIFDRPLTGDEHDAVGSYLALKYNLSQYAVGTSAPTTPTNLFTTGLAPYQLNLQWKPTSTNASSFIIERKPGTGGSYQEIGSVPFCITNFVDTTAIPTNQYFYVVQAHNWFGGYSSNSLAISPPTVSITNWPATILENTNNVIAAQAADVDGTVAKVDLYEDGTWQITANSSPYVFNWIPTFEGTHVLTALGTDNQGNSQFSQPVGIIIYLDSNGDGIPDYLQVSQGNDPINPWVVPSGDTNTVPPTINLVVPANATLLP